MQRLKIGVDVDGVLANFSDAFKKEAENLLGRTLVGPPANWDMTNWFTKAEESKVWAKVKSTPDWFYLYISPLPGVYRNIPWLVAEHEVYFVTTRIETAGLPVQRQTQLWLGDLGLECPTVIVTKDKGLVANALHLDRFIDDKPENLEDIAKHSPETRLYLQNASYNFGYAAPANWTRVESFESFVDVINE